MKLQQILNYILIVVGGVIVFYAQSGTQQNDMILILGIVLLMLGVYRISRNIPSKFENEQNDDNNSLS